MILPKYKLVYQALGWPRTSGDDPYGAQKVKIFYALAPHERG